MRRSEFISDSVEEYNEITSMALDGHLGIVDKRGYPRIVPLNFVSFKGSIYVHGAKSGEKFELAKSNPKTTFSVSIPYSYIPSYFKSEKYACPATQFFKSLHIRGRLEIVESVEEKAAALDAMMRKYQPEGRFTTISADNPIYKNALQGVAVLAVRPEEVTMKIKFGQNMSTEEKENVIRVLQDRGEEVDLLTIKMIKKYNP